jgi:hypothetical protein
MSVTIDRLRLMLPDFDGSIIAKYGWFIVVIVVALWLINRE